MTFLGLTKKQRTALEMEVVSARARRKFTRLVRSTSQAAGPSIQILRLNQIINIANNVMTRPIYRLESDDDGDYQAAEHAWHNGEAELIFSATDDGPTCRDIG